MTFLTYLGWAEYLAAAAGLAYLVARRRRCPRAARVGAVALAVFLAFNFLTFKLPGMVPGSGASWVESAAEWAGADRRTAIRTHFSLTVGVQTSCYLLLAWAAVIGRRPPGGPPAAEPWVPGSAGDAA